MISWQRRIILKPVLAGFESLLRWCIILDDYLAQDLLYDCSAHRASWQWTPSLDVLNSSILRSYAYCQPSWQTLGFSYPPFFGIPIHQHNHGAITTFNEINELYALYDWYIRHITFLHSDFLLHKHGVAGLFFLILTRWCSGFCGSKGVAGVGFPGGRVKLWDYWRRWRLFYATAARIW